MNYTVRTLPCRSRQLKTKPIADGCLGFGRAQQGVDRLDPVPAFGKDLSEEPVIDGADRAWVPGRKNVGQRFESRRAKPGPLIRHYDMNSRDSATRNKVSALRGLPSASQ
jgi:hypothetical protein